MREGILVLLEEPLGDCAREASAWERLAGGSNMEEEKREAILSLTAQLPFPGAGEAAPADSETWRRHGGEAFALLDRVCWMNRSVLEVGAGRCWLTAELARRGARAVALDIVSHPAVGLGAGEAFLRDGPPFGRVLADMHNLPFADSSFDAAAATAALHHSPDLPALARELARVVRPGGLLLFANEPLRLPFRQRSAEEEAGAHEGSYSPWGWERLLRGAGWSILHLKAGAWADLHGIALNDGRGAPPPLRSRLAAHFRYLHLLALAPPRRLLAFLREASAAHPARPCEGGRVLWAARRLSRRLSRRGGAVFGPGWHGEEVSAEGAFRWSAPLSLALLPPSPRGALLALASFRPDISSHPVRVEARLGRGPRVSFLLDSPGWRELAVPPPRGRAARRPTLLRLRVRGGHFVPAERGWGEDRRRLGVACRTEISV